MVFVLSKSEKRNPVRNVWGQLWCSQLTKDLSGELEFEEMVDGLLKCRGPVSKTDIIAIRLKSSLIVRQLNAVCDKLGIDV